MTRIPRQLTLDSDIVVKVRFVAPSIIAGILGKENASVWDHENNIIWIDKSLSMTRRWACYRHELIHAILDIHEMKRGGI